MKVVVLCGGRGTRLREETEFRPKPMVPIGEKPILWHIMKTYACRGFDSFILCLGYKGEMIKDYFRNYLWHTADMTMRLGADPSVHFHNDNPPEEWTVTLASTGEDSMTASRIHQIRKYLGDDDTFLLSYGDGVGNVDISTAIECHRRMGRVVTLTAVHPPGRFGELRLRDDSVVREFNEKPQTEGGYINGGFMVCSTRVFDYLSEDPSVMFEQEPLRRLTAEGQLAAFKHDGFWQPMDTYQEFLLLNRLWAAGTAPWKIW